MSRHDKIINNNNGSAAITFSIFVTLISFGYYYYQSNILSFQQKLSAKQVTDTRLKIVQNKISRMSGYLVANNLIACKQTGWENGTIGKTCQWNRYNYLGSSSFKPEDFGLKSKGIDEKNKLLFDVSISELLKGDESNKLVTGANTWLKFSLIEKNEINVDSGQSSSIQDSDKFLVLVEGSIEYKALNGKVISDTFNTILKRPLGVPKVKVLSSSCAQRCDVSSSEHSSPACRSNFYVDKNTMTSLEATTTNLGPGLIYNINYNRKLAFNNGASLSQTQDKSIGVNIGVKDFIIPGSGMRWADTFPCGAFSQTLVDSKIVSTDFNEVFDSLFSLDWAVKERVVSLIVSDANAQSYQHVGSTSSTNQHSYPAGSVIYEIDPKIMGASIEPFRLTAPINEPPSSFAGLMNTTTVTNFYTQIWVSPPH